MESGISRASSRTEGLDERFTEERCFIVETWNDPLDPSVSVSRARVAPGMVTARHALAVDERYIIESGRGRVDVEGIESSDVAPGDVVLIPAGATQRIRNPGPQDLVFLCICTPRFEPEHYEDREAPR